MHHTQLIAEAAPPLKAEPAALEPNQSKKRQVTDPQPEDIVVCSSSSSLVGQGWSEGSRFEWLALLLR